MAALAPMPPVVVSPAMLAPFGTAWQLHQKLGRTPPHSSSRLGQQFDSAVASSLAVMLGGIPVLPPTKSTSLVAPTQDCVECGPVRVIGGIRPQNFDVGYRPDGVRFAFDSKTLNDTKSVGKNWQNMLNDLATESTTVHSRFPHAVVAFIVAFPTPCLSASLQGPVIETLERLARRVSVHDSPFLAESVALVLWDPANGQIDATIPPAGSPLRIEAFHLPIEATYVSRYRGLPPHGK